MGLIIGGNNNYLEFTAVLDFQNSSVINTFVLNNTLGVVSINDTGTAGQFKITLTNDWVDQRTFIENQPAPNNFDPITDVYFICWNRNASYPLNILTFDILDKNGNYATNLTVNGIGFNIRVYNSQTNL